VNNRLTGPEKGVYPSYTLNWECNFVCKGIGDDMKKLLILIVTASIILAGCGKGLSESKAEKMLKDMVDKKVSYMSWFKDVRVTKITHDDRSDSWSVHFVVTNAKGKSFDYHQSFLFTGEKWCMSGGGSSCAFEFSSSGDFLKKNPG
jgi:pentatricopeptide repeat protein